MTEMSWNWNLETEWVEEAEVKPVPAKTNDWFEVAMNLATVGLAVVIGGEAGLMGWAIANGLDLPAWLGVTGGIIGGALAAVALRLAGDRYHERICMLVGLYEQ
jgi:hypothetical protein